jgi:hypothetical protein
VVEALLRELALFSGYGAVMDEHGDTGAPHVLGDGLRRGPGLAEEQALAARSDLRRVAGEFSEVRAVDDEDLPGLGWLGGLTTRPVRPDVPCIQVRMASGLPTVAESPTRWTSCREMRARRSITLIKWAPRSDPASAWISSTITVRRSAKSLLSSTRADRSITSSDSSIRMRR